MLQPLCRGIGQRRTTTCSPSSCLQIFCNAGLGQSSKIWVSSELKMDNTATFSLLHHINHNPHPMTVPRKQSQKLLEKTGIAFVFCSSQSLIFPSITVRDNTFNFRKRCFPEMELPYQTVDLEYRLQLRVSGESTTFKKRKTFFSTMSTFITFPTKPVPQPLSPVFTDDTWIHRMPKPEAQEASQDRPHLQTTDQ